MMGSATMLNALKNLQSVCAVLCSQTNFLKMLLPYHESDTSCTYLTSDLDQYVA